MAKEQQSENTHSLLLKGLKEEDWERIRNRARNMNISSSEFIRRAVMDVLDGKILSEILMSKAFKEAMRNLAMQLKVQESVLVKKAEDAMKEAMAKK